jgi:hypothetical protein
LSTSGSSPSSLHAIRASTAPASIKCPRQMGRWSAKSGRIEPSAYWPHTLQNIATLLQQINSPPRFSPSMKSTEVYSLLRHQLAGELKSLGFRREKSFLSWSRHKDNLYTVLWCQVSQDGWDEYAGSKFTVEFQRSAESVVGSRYIQRKRIGKLLSVASLRKPPKNHPVLSVSPELTKSYLAKFEQDLDPYARTQDIWFRYARPEHVDAWAAFLIRAISQCVEAIEQSIPPTGE